MEILTYVFAYMKLVPIASILIVLFSDEQTFFLHGKSKCSSAWNYAKSMVRTCIDDI